MSGNSLDGIRKKLQSPKSERLYQASVKSIFDRLYPDGYFPESLTGAYQGMFPRTVGPLVMFFIRLGEKEKAERVLDFVFRAIQHHQMERVPHVIGPFREDGQDPCFRDRDQVDGQAHVVVAWARLILNGGCDEFEKRTYPLVSQLTNRMSDAPYVRRAFDGHRYEMTLNGLVRNGCLEHSRDGRYWDTFDLLSQSFVCAALEEMIAVASRRQDSAAAALWQKRLKGIEEAIQKLMTRTVDGKTVYLEMRLPDGGEGKPFDGFSWINWAPVAAGWKGVDKTIMRNTIDAYAKRAQFEWQGKRIIGMEYGPSVLREVLGKGLGWELLYNFQEGDFARVEECLSFLEEVNPEGPYLEFAFFESNGNWRIKDQGNGEQCVWLCWALRQIREAVGIDKG